MKKILLLILLLNAQFSHAQNYNCLNSEIQQFYANSKGYLRYISVDSVRAIGADTVYYPYKTTRLTWTLLDTNRGSWVGSNVIKKANGMFLFNTAWNDTIFINTQAEPGDTWIFYDDTSTRSYMATLVNVDTMSFLGILDSVKRIKITAYAGGVINTTDTISRFEILLSKNNGFVQNFDLYLFPYHNPTTPVYSSDIDPYLHEFSGYSGPITLSDFIFSVVDYHIPTKLEIFDFNEGDVFISSYTDIEYCALNSNYKIAYDSITDKVVLSPYHTQYTVYRTSKYTTVPNGPGARTYSIYSSSYVIDADTSILPGFETLPESVDAFAFAWYYWPKDTANCRNGPLYKHKNIVTFEGCEFHTEYKAGFPLISGQNSFGCYTCPPDFGAICSCEKRTNLLFSQKGGIPCGTRPLMTIGIKETPVKSTFLLSPNPANSILKISSPDKISTVIIYSIMGQVALQQTFSAREVSIDVSQLPAGLYFAKINEMVMAKFMKQ